MYKLYLQMIGSLNAVTCPADGIVHQEPTTDAYIKGECLGTGTLYIAEDYLTWSRSDEKGIQLSYPSVSIHAISRDTSSFPHRCLFLMLDQNLTNIQLEPNEDSGDSDSESQTGVGEVRFVPACTDNLEVMYRALCTCQQLHPDEDDQDSEGGDEYYESLEAGGDGPEDGVALSAQGRANLARMEQMLSTTNGSSHEAMEEDDNGQFEDVE